MKKLQESFKFQSNAMEVEAESSIEVISNDDYDEDCEQGFLVFKIINFKKILLFRIVLSSSCFPVCCGSNKTEITSIRERRITCILCQENDTLTANGREIVCAGFIQKYFIYLIVICKKFIFLALTCLEFLMHQMKRLVYQILLSIFLHRLVCTQELVFQLVHIQCTIHVTIRML